MNKNQRPQTLSARIAEWPPAAFGLFAGFAAFTTYFCMYAFRKPFAAAAFSGQTFLDTGIGLKTALVISQILGYTLSKFIGIKVCSETRWEQRLPRLLGLVAIAWLALAAYAVLPGSWKGVAIFFNGLPLGMIWGMVVGYLEGRRTSELLLAFLSCSFIVAGGAVKDVGIALMQHYGISESLMPAAVGALFAIPFAASAWLLSRLPRPSAEDQAERCERATMDKAARWAFLKRFRGGTVALLVVGFLALSYRDFWDNFGVELFAELGYRETPAIFTRTTLPIAFGVMASLALLNLVRDNKKGLLLCFLLMIAGVGITALATAGFQAGLISGGAWMSWIGLGTYVTYVPFGSVLFDRIIAETRAVGTAVHTIYIVDAAGYCGAVAVQLYKDLFAGAQDYLNFFVGYTWVYSIVAFAGLLGACVYFLRRAQPPIASPAP